MDLEDDFNAIQFEKRLTALKDSQDNINACCKWCLENRKHHKKIVASWLNVLKRVKVEQRLTLFYLANDVIQYSKRKQYEYVESWGTALQKATTMVRDDRVKHKIMRIFNIWQQRGVYNEEFISDLCGLISVIPTATKGDEPHEFQANYVVNKIKQCSKLESETDLKLKVLKEHNPKIQIESDSLFTLLKDRAHVDDVDKELEVYVKHLEGYINALKSEIKCRITNISVLKQANNHLDKDKKDVKVVANAYKIFGNKVKGFQKKLEEHKSTLISPVPSPDVNAPSPSPDCDIELPDDSEVKTNGVASNNYNHPSTAFPLGYYNPVPPPTTEPSSFVTNGYTSFMGSNFNALNFNPSGNNAPPSTPHDLPKNLDLSNVLQSINQPPPPPADAPLAYQYQDGGAHLPLLPPPMPPFSAKADYEHSYPEKANSNFNSARYPIEDYRADAANGANQFAPSADDYNPEQEPETWDPDSSWSQMNSTDTPESPPNFEKQGYVEGIEYHDNVVSGASSDVDHRILHPIPPAMARKDVDHRNLISLTGSPADTNSNNSSSQAWNTSEKDYAGNIHVSAMDQDYRLSPFIEQLKLPPPPPPPPKPPILAKKQGSPKKLIDNNESIDMELSEDETEEHHHRVDGNHHRLFHRFSDSDRNSDVSLKPPPPFPDLLPDDVDANTFLDDLDNELNSNEFTANLSNDFSPGGPPPPLPPAHMPPPNYMPWKQDGGFRRGGHRGGGFVNRGRGRGFGFRGGGSFRGRGFPRGGGFNRGMRPPRAGMRGNYQGGY